MALTCSLTQIFTFAQCPWDFVNDNGFSRGTLMLCYSYELFCTYCFAHFNCDLWNVPKRLRKTAPCLWIAGGSCSSQRKSTQARWEPVNSIQEDCQDSRPESPNCEGNRQALTPIFSCCPNGNGVKWIKAHCFSRENCKSILFCVYCFSICFFKLSQCVPRLKQFQLDLWMKSVCKMLWDCNNRD